MRGRKQITLHPPGPWRKKLSDDSITNSDIRQMKINLHSTYLPSDQLDKLCRIKFGKSQFGMSSVHAGTSEDPWCLKCLNRVNQEVENSILHSFYTCPSTKTLIAATIAYFAPGSNFPDGKTVILSTNNTVFDNLPNSDLGKQLSSLVLDKLIYIIALQLDKQTLPSTLKLIQMITSDLSTLVKCKPASKLGKLLKDPLLTHYTQLTIRNLPL